MEKLNSDKVIEKIKNGSKLFLYKSFKISSGSLMTARALPGNTITYKFDDNTRVHHTVGNSLLKKAILKKGEATKTLGGSKTELILID